MKLGPIIAELRAHAPSFENRIYGAAEYSIIDSTTDLAMPCGFVLPLGESILTSDVNNNIYQQAVEQSFGVAVYVATENDEQGIVAYDRIEDLKTEVLRAIAGWQPTEMSEWVTYEGSSILDLNRARLCVQFEFSVVYPIEDDETRHNLELSALGAFKGLDIDVDLMRPDGQIEAKAKIDLGEES